MTHHPVCGPRHPGGAHHGVDRVVPRIGRKPAVDELAGVQHGDDDRRRSGARQRPVIAAAGLPQPGARRVDAQGGSQDQAGVGKGGHPQCRALGVRGVGPIQVEARQGQGYQHAGAAGGEHPAYLIDAGFEWQGFVCRDAVPGPDLQVVQERLEMLGNPLAILGQVACADDRAARGAPLRADLLLGAQAHAGIVGPAI